MIQVADFQHGHLEMTYIALERLSILLLDEEKDIDISSWLSATLKLCNKQIAKLLEGMDGVWLQLSALGSSSILEGNGEGLA